MKAPFYYRSYRVSSVDDCYVAMTDDEGDDFSIISKQLIKVLRGIDGIWSALGTIDGSVNESDLPGWLRVWLKNPSSTIKLDEQIDQTLVCSPVCLNHTNLRSAFAA